MLPPIQPRRGPLAIDVVYPAEGDALTASDSNFVFGSVGTGDARLTIGGVPVEVAPNGAFLAFVPVPRDGAYRVEAEANGQRASAVRHVRLPAAAWTGEGIAPGGVSPRGAMTVAAGERITVRVRGSAGAQVALVFADGRRIPLAEQTSTERPEGFMRDRAPPVAFTEYVGSFPATEQMIAAADRTLPAPTLVPVDPARDARIMSATVEMWAGPRRYTAPLDLNLDVLERGEVRAGVAAGSRSDSVVFGRSMPGSGTPYHWFLPNGTRLTLTGERDGAYRVRLAQDLDVWVDAKDVRLLPAGTPPPDATVETVRLDPQPGWVDLRLATSARVPFRVDADDASLRVEVYGARTRTNWMQYGPQDTMVRRMEWAQPATDRFTVTLGLARAPWGWRAFWDRDGSLVVRIRRAPEVDARQPLRGRYIAVDAGHPPGGAIGPTRLTEAEVNLAVAQRLARMLRDAGARVLETRPTPAAVDLQPRTLMAADSNVDLLVSIHNNAFPDGVNPFTNAGTTAFYNAPQSLALARALQRELLAELGLRDLGIAHADLALVRPTWFPSTLTETMFLMVPRQENALRDPAVQERIARAHFRAIESFFRDHATAP
jgi:N-acetylmuramoyl-L-alanine amidase